jgi:predicted RNA polymerase sigma factor
VMFSEGYVARSGLTLGRIELTIEAMRLARTLHRDHDDAETTGLVALMLLTEARRSARSGPNGEIIPLDEQDRSLWNRAAIEEGTALAQIACARGGVGPLAIQAAIAALHDNAKSVRATDWPQVMELYDALLSIAWSPGAALSRVVARAMTDGATSALADLDQLVLDPRVRYGHRADAVRAHLLEMVGQKQSAMSYYAAAAGKTASVPERNYLLLRASRLSK